MSSGPTLPEKSKVEASNTSTAHETGTTGGHGECVTIAAPTTTSPTEEDVLRRDLRSLYSRLKIKEPLEPSYKRLLQNGSITSRRPALVTSDKFYARVHGALRTTVEDFMQATEGKDPFDKISTSGQRPVFPEGDSATMRAAFSLREGKLYEQRALLDATLTALPRRHGMDEWSRRQYLESVAQGLQQKPSALGGTNRHLSTPALLAAETIENTRLQAELERQHSMARARETARTKRDMEDRAAREASISQERAEREGYSTSRESEAPNLALRKVYYPIFRKLWDMEFSHLGNINPFRMVIDKENCASLGAPDYFDFVKTPMNLTYIQEKVESAQYESLGAFSADVDLMLSNAILYNSSPDNPYRIAAEEMKKKYNKIVKKIVQTIQQKR